MSNTDCNSCYYCYYCNFCEDLNFCNFCYYCNFCESIYYCNFCEFCNSCEELNFCYYCKNLKMTECNIFCFNETNQKRYRAFNKEVWKDRYTKILRLIKNDILKDLNLKIDENNWKEEWKKVTTAQWLRMKNEIPEFNQEIVENIIEFKLELDNNPEELTLEQVCKELGRNIKVIK